uniref:Uncharacterized protein n=1 Tax=Arundo donax TaxID=35708 RepID=A0A0A9Q2Y1_ARUDO
MLIILQCTVKILPCFHVSSYHDLKCISLVYNTASHSAKHQVVNCENVMQ